SKETIIHLHSLSQNDFAKRATGLLQQSVEVVLDKNGIRLEHSILERVVPRVDESQILTIKIAAVAQQDLRRIISNPHLESAVAGEKTFYQNTLTEELKDAVDNTGGSISEKQQALREIELISNQVIETLDQKAFSPTSGASLKQPLTYLVAGGIGSRKP